MRLAGKETTTALKEERAQRLAKKMKAILATESGEPDVAVMALGKLLSTPAVRELALTETWAATGCPMWSVPPQSEVTRQSSTP